MKFKMKSKHLLTKLIVFVVLYLQVYSASNVSNSLDKKYKTFCENNRYSCLKLNMLMEIRKMNRNKYYPLTEDVWLEQINKNVSAPDDTNDLKQLKLNKNNVKLNKIISELNNVFKTHSLFMNVVPGKDLEIYRSNPDGKFNLKLQGDSARYPYYVVHSPSTMPGETRTFGFARRRLMMAIIPIMFKMGVMMTMLVVLTFLTLKSLTIGGILLFIAVTSLLSKFKHWISPHHHSYASSGDKSNIHLHIHTENSHGAPWGSGSHIDPHSSYSSYSDGNSWSRQGVGGDNSITGTLNGHHIHIPLPTARNPPGYPSPSAMYNAPEDYTFLGKSSER